MISHCLNCCYFILSHCAYFFFQRAIVWGSQWDINDLLRRFTWGKLKEGPVYRGVARVQGCAHGLAMVGCCHLHEAWRGKWRKSQHWSLREFTLLRGAPGHWSTEAGRRHARPSAPTSSGLLVVLPNCLLRIVSWRRKDPGCCRS